ncbi:hypothetical protein [Candidatus Poriferisodalis sp.]|uniref:hypothetical protein n=1 Tax=Candidatus Poriferisodalis sp. TaxID=3101277 RepID=UPI003B02C218
MPSGRAIGPRQELENMSAADRESIPDEETFLDLAVAQELSFLQLLTDWLTAQVGG